MTPRTDKYGINHYGKTKPYPGGKFAEDKLQEVVTRFFAYQPKLNYFHVANERKTTPQKGAILKRKGVKTGVADCIINTPTKTGFHGMDIELKVKGGKLSDNQRDFLLKSKDDGRFVAVCWNFAAVEYLIKEHY